MEFSEGSVKPLSEKLTAKSRRAKIKLTLYPGFGVNDAGSHGFKNMQNFEAVIHYLLHLEMRINLKQNFLQVSFICAVYVWNFIRLLKRIDLKSTW